MSVISNQQFYWVNNDEIIYLPARYTVDSEGNAICTHTFSLDHVFDECTRVADYGLFFAFSGCTDITGNVSFPKLTSVGYFGLQAVFQGCAGITGSISFPKLTSIDYCGLYYTFSGCTGITGSVSFPKLTSIGTRGLYYAFDGCTGITEIHFSADAQSTVEATGGYETKFGASNATIYFDL